MGRRPSLTGKRATRAAGDTFVRPTHITTGRKWLGRTACGLRHIYGDRLMTASTAERHIDVPKLRKGLCKKCVKALRLKPSLPPRVKILACKYCSTLVLGANSRAQCPKGCPGNWRIHSVWEIPHGQTPRKLRSK